MKITRVLPATVFTTPPLSPLRGWTICALYPRLAPWAAFLRRFAAEATEDFTNQMATECLKGLNVEYD